ncbi:MAG: hypothetical protein LBP69_09845 [Treponema sp.]|nr:hypothetical protein [Treponema sp.]
MEAVEKETVGLTVRIPEATYKVFMAYRERFKPHMSLNALIVESIIEEIERKAPALRQTEETAAEGRE